MFDLGWTELLVIGIVALIVVGPKDLPILFRKVGQFVGKAKGMAREFSSAMNQAADEAGVSDIQKGLNAATNPMKSATDSVKEAAKSFQNWEPDSETGKLSAERAESAKKIHDAAAKKAQERLDREAAARAASAQEDPGMVDDTAPAPAKPANKPAKTAAKAAPKAKAKAAPKAKAKPKAAAKPKTEKPAAATAKTAKKATKAKPTKDSA